MAPWKSNQATGYLAGKEAGPHVWGPPLNKCIVPGTGSSSSAFLSTCSRALCLSAHLTSLHLTVLLHHRSLPSQLEHHSAHAIRRLVEMKIQCDVCEKAVATIVCCADEAALCEDCDVQVHAANKLASKHPRLLLNSIPSKHPRCDICQEKPAFIFCVEDRALFCKDCDEPIHAAGSLSGKHQRLLATGIGVALISACNKKDVVKANCSNEPSNSNSVCIPPKAPASSKAPVIQEVPSAFSPPSSWSVEEFLQLSDYESTDKKGSHIGFGELDWFTDMSIFHNDEVPNIDALTAAQVPEMPNSQVNSVAFHKPFKSSMVSKRPRVESLDDFFAVPDLG